MNEAPSTIGPYQILGTLGAGGMGVVYRAVHVHNGQSAALKTVKVPRDGLVRSIRREIHALASTAHPGVVRVLDEGVHQGLPWYAMELLDGVPLRRYCAPSAAEASPASGAGSPEAAPSMPPTRWWTDSLGGSVAAASSREIDSALPRSPRARLPRLVGHGALADVLTLVRRICAPLAYLHGEGIVHRDLKPENILVCGEGRPVLVDFGLVAHFAARLGREALELSGEATGTIAYMAPEQGRGDFVDARADLYSLGCILYELLAGRPPFIGTAPMQVLWQHFEAKPVPPSQLVDGIPAELDALVLRLLAKAPRQRFGYADDVAAALGRLGAEDGLASEGPRPRAYLYRPGFAGREQAVALLEERLARLKKRSGGMVLVGGQSGVGKTRLLMELGRRAAQRDLVVLTGECLDQPGRPLEALRKPLQAVADRCRERGEPETERLLGPRGKLLSRYEPSLAGLPGQDRHDDPVELSVEAERLRLFDALTQTLQELARSKPLLLIFDDLQWADELTLAFSEHLLRAMGLNGLAVLVVGTYRSEELGDRLRGLVQNPEAQRLDLGRLDENAVASMIRDMLALESPAEMFSRFLTRHSEGNPFFVAEYLRAALAEGLLWKDPEGRWHVAGPEARNATAKDYETLPLPSSLRELLARRLQRLPKPSLAVLEAASILGRDVHMLALRAMVRQQNLRFLGALVDLMRRQILEEVEAPAGALHDARLLRFAHDKMREVALERIETHRTPELHRRAARAIESGLAGQRDELLAALGRHWEQAREPDRARPYYLAGARRAAKQYAGVEAESLYRAYLALADQPTADSIAARNELGGEILFAQGRGPEAVREHEIALEEARTLGDVVAEARSLVHLGGMLGRMGQLDTARAAMERSLEIVLQAGDQQLEAMVRSELAGILFRQGESDRAYEMLAYALAIHRAKGNRQAMGRVLANLAILHDEQGEPHQAQTLFERALEIERDAGDRRMEGHILRSLGTLLSGQHQLEAAAAHYEQALAIHRQIGDRQSEAVSLATLAELRILQGRPKDARVLCDQGLPIHREVGDRIWEAITLGILASSHLRQNDLEAAQAICDKALATDREIGFPEGEARHLGILADILLEQGDLQKGRACCVEAVSICRESGLRTYEAKSLLQLGTMERRIMGSLAQAETCVEAACTIFEEQGDVVSRLSCLFELGHIALALKQPATQLILQAEAVSAGLQRPVPAIQAAECSLRQAQAAFEAGQPIFHGELIESIPEGLRRWLAGPI